MNIRVASLVAITLLLSQAITSQAQPKWSAGYRTGLELVNYQLTHEDFKGENCMWNNQLFLTRRLSNSFELEATLFHNNKNYSNTSMSSLFEMDSISNNVKESKLGLSVAGKYHILKKPNWTLYAQLGFTFVKISDHYNNSTYKQGVVQQRYTETTNSITLFDRTFGGLGLDYNLTKCLYLTSTFNVYNKLHGLSYPGNAYYNNWAANVLVGAGFRI